MKDLKDCTCITKRTPENIKKEIGLELTEKQIKIYNIIKDNPGISERDACDKYNMTYDDWTGLGDFRLEIDFLLKHYMLASYWLEFEV